MTGRAGALRRPVLDDLLRLTPVVPGSGLRVLELDADPQAGASAADLAARCGGSVVSLSQSSRAVSRARAAHATGACLAFHRRPLAAGWPPGAPYDLVLAWPLLGSIPRAWVEQCAPGGRVVAPAFLYSEGCIAIVRLSVDHAGSPISPVAGMPAPGSLPGAVTWEIEPARMELVGGGYRVSLERKRP